VKIAVNLILALLLIATKLVPTTSTRGRTSCARLRRTMDQPSQRQVVVPISHVAGAHVILLASLALQRHAELVEHKLRRTLQPAPVRRRKRATPLHARRRVISVASLALRLCAELVEHKLRRTLQTAPVRRRRRATQSYVLCALSRALALRCSVARQEVKQRRTNLVRVRSCKRASPLRAVAVQRRVAMVNTASRRAPAHLPSVTPTNAASPMHNVRRSRNATSGTTRMRRRLRCARRRTVGSASALVML
jgi:hypothetical protein